MKLYRNWIINEVARAGEHTNERTYVRTYVRTYSHTYVRDRPYIPSTTLLCEGIIKGHNISFMKKMKNISLNNPETTFYLEHRILLCSHTMYGPILDLILACVLLSCCILQARGLICREDVICDEEESAGPLCGSDGITYGMENYGLLNLYCEIIWRRTGRLASASQPYIYERVPNIS